jgi:hypothetical protein
MYGRRAVCLGLLLITSVAFADELVVDFTDNSLPLLNENMRKLRDDADHAPRICTGVAAPTSTPQKKGDMFLNTVLGKVYVSTGTSASSDWKILN